MAITVTHSKVSTIPDGDDSSLIRPSDWNDDHVLDGLGTMAEQDADNVAITGGSITGTSIPAADVTGLGTMATQDADDVSITGGSISGTTVSGYIPTSEKGQALGVATLDSGGQVPLSQIPPLGDLVYQGTWDASLNIPVLVSSVGVKGYYYVVNVAGSTNLNGITDWQIGDWAVFNGLVWEKIDNTDSVTSVNGFTGTVVLTYSDVGAANAGANTNITSMSGITGSIATVDTVGFDTTYATTLTAGQLGWDGNNTLGLGMAGGNVIQRIGEDTYIYVKASASITKGQLVMFTGVVGASSVVTAAPSTGVTSGQYIIGLAAESIALNGFGLIQVTGSLKGFNTSAFTDGDILYYDSAVTGGMTNVYPTSGLIVTVAAVTNASSGGAGSVQIRVSVTQRITASTGISVSQNGTGTTVTNTAPDQVVSISGGTGISTSGTYPSFTVTNTAPDQTVVMTSGTGISVTGTYPNFTVTNTSPSSGGTVTSVSGTAPIASSGGNTPAISISQATTSTDGYLSSTDWNTFNSKQPAGSYLTTVTADSPLTGSGTSGSHLSIPAASGSVNGYLTSTDWTTFNSKAAPFTYTTTYIPYGQGTTTPNQSSSFTFDGTTQVAPIQRASNGIVCNSRTVSASFSIPSGDSAMSAGPITIASGVTVTVPSGGKWVVL